MAGLIPESLPTGAHLSVRIIGPATLLSPLQIAEREVPAGFQTDLASTPRALWWLIPPFGRYLVAAIVHDYHYMHQDVTRREADAEFYRLMYWYGVAWWKRWAMWGAVRCFGWGPWRRNARRAPQQPYDGFPVSQDEE